MINKRILQFQSFVLFFVFKLYFDDYSMFHCKLLTSCTSIR